MIDSSKFTRLILMCFVALVSTASTFRLGAQTDSDSTGSLYKAEAGPHDVKIFDDLALKTDSDSRPLQLRITYPIVETDDKLPVIVFSHGAGGSNKAYQPLIKYWTSHGYVCIQGTHGDSVSLMSPSQKRKYRSLKNYASSSALGKHQLTRPKEIKLILDRFSEIEKAIPELKGRLDAERIGMGGHSFGAHTTQMVGGLSLRNIRGQERTKVEDERPKALLMISPQGTGGQIDKESWKDISRPTMVITGTRDRGRKGQPHTWRLEVFDHLPAEQKYLTFIKNATHNFGGISGVRFAGSGSENEDHVNYVKSASLAFWDTHLRDTQPALEFLKSDQMKLASKQEASISTGDDQEE